MKKTLFLSAILGAALCSNAFGETLTLTEDTTYSSAISEDTIDLNGHKLTFSADAEPTQTVTGSGNIIVGSTSVANVDVSGLSLSDVSLGASYNAAQVSTYGIQVYKTGSATLSFTGQSNTAAGVCVREGNSSLTLKAAKDTTAKLTVTGNMNTDKSSDSITVGDGMVVSISKANTKLNTWGIGNDAFTNFFKGSPNNFQLSTAGSGVLELVGDFDYTVENTEAQTYTSANNLAVVGNVTINTWGHTGGNKTYWKLEDHSMSISGDLWMTNWQYMQVNQGGTLAVDGQLKLGHVETNAAGRYCGGISIASGGSATLKEIVFIGGANTIEMNGGSLTFTKTDGNVLSGLLNGAGTANNTVNLTDAKLDAVDNSWTMTAGTLTNASTTEGHGTVQASVSLAGNTTLNVGAEKSITLGNASVQGTVTGSGALTLNNATLAGNLTLQAADDAATTVTLTGTLTNSDTANKSITVGKGATLVMNDNTKTGLKLAGGTVKVSGTDNFNAQHFSSLTLTANSTLDLTSQNSGLINKNGSTFINSTLNLGEGNTLTINGTKRFCVMDAETTGTGKIAMGTTGGYLQIAHSGVKDHLADLSSAVVELYGTHLVIAGGNTLKVAALDQHADSTTGSALETEGSENGSGVLEIVGDGGTHTYRGGVHANAGNIEIAMTGEGTQKFSMSGNMQLRALTADAGTMNFYLNNNVLSAGSLTLSGGAVNVFKGDNNSDAGQITTSNLTVETTTELEANLVISEHGTMDFSSGATLTMGCTVTIGDDVTVIVSSDVLNYISRGEAMTIMYGVDNDTLESITLGDVHFTMDGQERSDFFFMTEADTVNGGMKLMVAPEPATATLSLLALAGLAARRRRH